MGEVMKKNHVFMMSLSVFLSCATAFSAHAQENYYSQPIAASVDNSLNIGIVNTKKCLENSKLGKEEQANFEKLKNQMETRLQEKKQALDEIEAKLDNSDWIDGVSDEAVNKLIRERKAIRLEGEQLQNQYMQTLQQVNMSIVQKLTDSINEACKELAKRGYQGKKPAIILTDEACTYFDASFDYTNPIVAIMDELFVSEKKTKDSSKTNL